VNEHPKRCRTDQIEKHTIYPYIHSFSNVLNHDAMLRPIKIPDVLPSDIPKTANFSLVAGESYPHFGAIYRKFAGDFEEVYGGNPDLQEPQAGLWDAILTCFFIDTVSDISVGFMIQLVS
jgi:carnosine N-methyltransferase